MDQFILILIALSRSYYNLGLHGCRGSDRCRLGRNDCLLFMKLLLLVVLKLLLHGFLLFKLLDELHLLVTQFVINFFPILFGGCDSSSELLKSLISSMVCLLLGKFFLSLFFLFFFRLC
jgi:hypothetical protein